MEIEILQYAFRGEKVWRLCQCLHRCRQANSTTDVGAYAYHLSAMLGMCNTSRSVITNIEEDYDNAVITITSYDHNTHIFMLELADLFMLDIQEI